MSEAVAGALGGALRRGCTGVAACVAGGAACVRAAGVSLRRGTCFVGALPSIWRSAHRMPASEKATPSCWSCAAIRAADTPFARAAAIWSRNSVSTAAMLDVGRGGSAASRVSPSTICSRCVSDRSTRAARLRGSSLAVGSSRLFLVMFASWLRFGSASICVVARGYARPHQTHRAQKSLQSTTDAAHLTGAAGSTRGQRLRRCSRAFPLRIPGRQCYT